MLVLQRFGRNYSCHRQGECRNFGKLSSFYSAYSRKPHFNIKLQQRKCRCEISLLSWGY